MNKLNINIFKSLPAHEKRLTWSTGLTLLRIVATPCIVAAMVTGYWGVAFWLFIGAAITDVLDGNLARWRNEKTFLGACLDPLADKFLVLSVFFTLAFVQSPLFSIPLWFVLLVLLREVVLIVGALIVYNIKGHLEVEPTVLGKMTTAVQMSFIAWLFACYFFNWLPVKTYYTMLGVLIILVFASFVQYAQAGMRQVRH